MSIELNSFSGSPSIPPPTMKITQCIQTETREPLESKNLSVALYDPVFSNPVSVQHLQCNLLRPVIVEIIEQGLRASLTKAMSRCKYLLDISQLQY